MKVMLLNGNKHILVDFISKITSWNLSHSTDHDAFVKGERTFFCLLSIFFFFTFLIQSLLIIPSRYSSKYNSHSYISLSLKYLVYLHILFVNCYPSFYQVVRKILTK